MSRHAFAVIATLCLGAAAIGKEGPEETISWSITQTSGVVDRGPLNGVWRILKADGNAAVVAGLPRDIRFDSELIEMVPLEGKLGGLDFRGPDGAITRAIYRFSGATLIVSQGKPNAPRPRGFHAGDSISVWSAERSQD